MVNMEATPELFVNANNKRMSCCAIFGCNNSYRNSNGKVRFFRFPSDPAVKPQWIKACRRNDYFNVHTACICSEHFEEEAFQNSLHQQLFDCSPKSSRELKAEAVPRLNLPMDRCITETEVSKTRIEGTSNRSQRNLVHELLEVNAVQESSNFGSLAEQKTTMENLKKDSRRSKKGRLFPSKYRKKRKVAYRLKKILRDAIPSEKSTTVEVDSASLELQERSGTEKEELQQLKGTLRDPKNGKGEHQSNWGGMETKEQPFVATSSVCVEVSPDTSEPLGAMENNEDSMQATCKDSTSRQTSIDFSTAECAEVAPDTSELLGVVENNQDSVPTTCKNSTTRQNGNYFSTTGPTKLGLPGTPQSKDPLFSLLREKLVREAEHEREILSLKKQKLQLEMEKFQLERERFEMERKERDARLEMDRIEQDHMIARERKQLEIILDLIKINKERL